MNDLYDYIFKIILIGDWGVGKSNIILRLTQDAFEMNSRTTIGVEFSQKIAEINDKKIIVQIWDTAGQDRYKAITSAYYRAAVGAILVYDISKKSSYESLTSWVKEIRDNTAEDVTVMLFGNKNDLENTRAVKLEEGEIFARKNNFLFREVSALTGENISEAFEEFIQRIFRSYKPDNRDDSRPTSKLSYADEIDHQSYLQKLKKGICC